MSTYVYYHRTQQRLMITQVAMTGSDYHMFLNTSNSSHNLSMEITLAKMFCIGFIMGGQHEQNGFKIVNDIHEFQ